MDRSEAKQGDDLIEVANHSDGLLLVDRREIVENADDGEKGAGLENIGGIHLNGNLVADMQAIVCEELLRNQDAIRSQRQPIHQTAQRLLCKVGAPPADERK